MSLEVADNPELERYEARLDGDLAGFAQYRVEAGQMTLFHTEVEPAFSGQGIGSALARSALEGVRSRGLQVVPHCSFIAAYVRRHPDLYLDLVPEPLRGRVMHQGS